MISQRKVAQRITALISQTINIQRVKRIRNRIKYQKRQSKRDRKKETLLKGIKESGSTIEDARKTKVLYKKYLMTECVLGIITLQTIIVNCIQYELDYIGYQKESRVCIYMMNFGSIIMIWLSILRYYQYNRLSYQRITDQSNYLYCALEILIICVQPYPFLSNIRVEQTNYYDQLTIYYKVNWFLNAFLMLRMYILIRVIFYLTNYLDNRMFRISRMFGLNPGYHYALKVLFKNHQVAFATIAFFVSVFVFVILIRIFERPVTDSLGYSNDSMNIGNFYNSIWFVIITMTTVGYGDLFAKTLYGRILNIFISIYGISIVSMTVSILQSFIMMDQPEKRTITVVKRLEAKKVLEEKAALVLTSSFRNILMYIVVSY